jgi:hypothetical protein
MSERPARRVFRPHPSSGTPEHEQRIADHARRIAAEEARLKLRRLCPCGGKSYH